MALIECLLADGRLAATPARLADSLLDSLTVPFGGFDGMAIGAYTYRTR